MSRTEREVDPIEELPDGDGQLFSEMDADTQAMLREAGEGFDAPPAEETPSAPPKMKRLQLRTGQVYTGKDESEILAKLIEAQENSSLTISDREAQIRELHGKARTQSQHDRVTDEQFDGQQYLDLLAEDPMQARRYQDKFYYGLRENEDPSEMLRYSYEVAGSISEKVAIGEFLQHNEDFEANTANATALLRRVEDEGLALTSRNLAVVFNDMKREGVFRSSPVEDNVEYDDIAFDNIPQPDKAGKMRRGRGAPPAPSGGGNRDASESMDFESMSAEDLEKEVYRRGMKKY